MEKSLQTKIQESVDKVHELLLEYRHGLMYLEKIDTELNQLLNYLNPQKCESFNVSDEYVSSDYVFDTFIEGDCNKLARLSAISVAERPGETLFNPFIIYSATGLGKTHLLQSIHNKIRNDHPEHKAIYISAEHFCLNLISAIKNNTVIDFITHLYGQDTLLIDDIHSFEKKEKTQEILIQIIDHYLNNGKQIVFSTTILPEEMKNMAYGLVSRISKGLIVKLDRPNSNTIVEILKTKAKDFSIEIPDIVIEELASKDYPSIREFEGRFIVWLAKAKILNKDIHDN